MLAFSLRLLLFASFSLPLAAASAFPTFVVVAVVAVVDAVVVVAGEAY